MVKEKLEPLREIINISDDNIVNTQESNNVQDELIDKRNITYSSLVNSFH